MSDATASPSSFTVAEALQAWPWYRWYGLSVLLVAYVFNFIDRSILGILTEPIKLALGIPGGGMPGAFAGRWINEAFTCQAAFMVVDLPGIALQRT